MSGKHPCRRDPLEHFNLSGPARNKRAAGLTASLCEIASTEVVLFAPVPLLAPSMSSPSSQLGEERVWRKGGKGKEENMDLEIQSSQDSTTSCSFILNGIYKAFLKFNSTVGPKTWLFKVDQIERQSRRTLGFEVEETWLWILAPPYAVQSSCPFL